MAEQIVPGERVDPARDPDHFHQPLRVRLPANEFRTEAQVREHYSLERRLADRLRSASKAERRTLYRSLYDELFRRLPEHPMLREKGLGRDVAPYLRFLTRFLNSGTVFMEIGPGDCSLSCRVAAMVKQVYAVDVSEEITQSVQFPPNFQLCLSDGTSIPVPDGSVNVAYSDQLMEHLHPDDAVEQLHNIYRALAPGGVYLCVTPNRLYGPSDISGYFDEIATGFHLREYSGSELSRLFRQAGFAETRFYVAPHGWYARWPASCAMALEFALDRLPHILRRRISTVKPLQSLAVALLGVRIAGIKAS